MKARILTLAVAMCCGTLAQAKTIRATELNLDLWSKLTNGIYSELVVEFREGDELPVTLHSEGDFLETSQPGTSHVVVKKEFWLKMIGNDVQMSLDGISYKPISEVISGSFSAGAGSDGGPANSINLVFSAYLK